MDLDFGSDMPEDEEAEQATQRSEAGEDNDAGQNEEDESMNDSDEGMEEGSPTQTRSMRSSRSPPETEDRDEQAQSPDNEDKIPLQDGCADCPYYDIVPTMAAPQATHINCIVTTKHLRWFFTGGQDGYIRKHDFHQSVTGKVPLTVAQKHPFVDTVQKSGVLLSYWENDEGDEEDNSTANNVSALGEKALSPVFCLAVQRDAMWILSGQYSGGINLQSVRIEEGKTVTTLRGHTAAVSALRLSRDERSLLSGSWDKQILDWDLETGKTRRSFVAGNKITGQVSTIALRPEYAPAIDYSLARPPAADIHAPLSAQKDSFQVSNNGESPGSSISFDPLFDEDDEKIDPLASMTSTTNGTHTEPRDLSFPTNADGNHGSGGDDGSNQDNAASNGPEDVFLSSCIDGTMSIWDRRQSDAIARIPLPTGVPPWCMSACWSLDGESFYCGRRNQTVEEYSMRSNMTRPVRTIKLPNNSGPVSCVTAMPNGKSLICASADNVRMYDLKRDEDSSGMPFMIIPGHHGGVISDFWVDESCRYAFSTSGNRGWDGLSTEVLLGYEIQPAGR